MLQQPYIQEEIVQGFLFENKEIQILDDMVKEKRRKQTNKLEKKKRQPRTARDIRDWLVTRRDTRPNN